MKMSRRARRMDRHHKRKKQTTGFNLVSLMDIFTILVFFLLVNSSDVEVLQNEKSITLPESFAEKKPKETLVVMVNNDNIMVQGRNIVSVPEAVNTSNDIIAALKQELEYQRSKSIDSSTGINNFTGEVTILGDKNIPYRLLKKIMVTCAKSNYEKISLAVSKKEQG